MSALRTRRRPRTSAAPAWTPASLSGVAAWWRADDVAGTDGSAVSSWADRIGAKTVAQATGTKQPTLKLTTNGINGQPVVRFASASAQCLDVALGALPAVGPFYYFAIYRQVSVGDGRLVSVGKSGNTSVGYGVSLSSVLHLTTYGVVDKSSQYGSGGTSPTLGFWGHSGTAYYLDRNNYYDLATGAAGNANTGSDTFSIGGRSTSNTEYVNADIAEVVVLTSLPSAADRYLMAKYVQTRYGIYTGTPYNTASFVTTPSADTSGTCVETSVLYFPSGWNGSNYWCAFVPYGAASPAANENPTILKSSDGNTWTSPAGAPVPVVAYPGGGAAGNNADPGLFYNPGDSKLYIFYQRENTSPNSTGGVWWTSSADGVTWSTPAQLIAATANNDNFESKVVYDTATSAWWLYTIDGSSPSATVLYRRVSTSGPTSGYGSRVACTLTLPNGLKIWHNGNVTQINGKWVSCFSDNQSPRLMWIASSTDGLNWTVGPRPLLVQGGVVGTTLQWDNTPDLYRLTLVDSGDGVNAWGWYSMRGTDAAMHMSQKVVIPFTEIP